MFSRGALWHSVSPEIASPAAAALAELSRTSVLVLIGYWYPIPSVSLCSKMNSKFRVQKGLWAENGA
jgi:hypothetical protein